MSEVVRSVLLAPSDEMTMKNDVLPYGGMVYVHVNPYSFLLKIGITGVSTDRAFYGYLQRHGFTQKGWIACLKFEVETKEEARKIERSLLSFYEKEGRRCSSPALNGKSEIVFGVFYAVLPLVQIAARRVRGESVPQYLTGSLNGALKTEKYVLQQKIFIDPRSAFFESGAPRFSELKKYERIGSFF